MAVWAKLYYQNGAFVHQRGTIFEIRPGDPGWTTEVDRGIIYTKLDAGTEELFWQRSDNTVEQITPASATTPASAGGLLSKTVGVDLTAAGPTPLFTVPAGEVAVVTKIVVVPTTIIGLAGVLRLGIGVTGTDIALPQIITNPSTAQGYILTVAGQTERALAAEVINLVHSTPSGAATFVGDIYLYGYFESGSAAVVSGAGADTTAIHDNIAAEIQAITNIVPVLADLLLIEDASDTFNKKNITLTQLQALIGGGKIIQARGGSAAGTGTCGFTCPLDSTIPQVFTEVCQSGSISIIPTNAANFLYIVGVVHVGADSARQVCGYLRHVGLSGNNVQYTSWDRVADSTTVTGVPIVYRVQANGTVAEVWEWGWGGDGVNNKYLNRSGTGNTFGATMISAIVILEVDES